MGRISSDFEADSGTLQLKSQYHFLYELYNSLCNSPYILAHTAILVADSAIHKVAYAIAHTLLLLSPLVFRTIYLKHSTFYGRTCLI